MRESVSNVQKWNVSLYGQTASLKESLDSLYFIKITTFFF
jgi:hypothetical protein